MFIDARKLPAGSTIDVDLCIIGGGAAGITMACEFIGQPMRVCLLESGGLRMQRETQQLYEGENVGIPYELDTTRSRYFGGSTNCWGGFSRPFEDFHFARREWVPESGWPISENDLSPYYRRAHEMCGIEAGAYDPQAALAAVAEEDLHPLSLPDSRLITHLTRLSKDRRCFGKAYRDEIRAAANVTVYLHANAVELEQADGGGRVDSVRVATLSGNRLQVRARWFVLATGAIENARLLLASNRTERSGVGNRYDQVGRYFMEHPRHVVAEVDIAPDRDQEIKPYLPRYALLRLPVAAELNVAYPVQREERLLDAAIYLELVLKGEEAASTKAAKQLFWDLWRGVRPRQPMQQIAAVASSPLSLATFGWGLFSCSERFVRCRRITLIAEQCPNPDSKVTLTGDRDRLGMPRVKLDWRLTELDHQTIRRTAEIAAEDLQRAGILGETRLMPDVEGDVLTPQWNWHHMGTTRMHDDPKLGVVDADGRVHGVGNLFVAGSSVFPTAGNHTPTLTLIALAIRLAQHIRKRAASSPVQTSRDRVTTSSGAEDAGLAIDRAARVRTDDDILSRRDDRLRDRLFGRPLDRDPAV